MQIRRRAFAALIALALAAPLRAGGPEQEVFEKGYSMEGISKISVENVNGNIEATAWDKPYFKVRAVKKAAKKPKRGVAARKGAARRAIKKAVKKVRRR